MKNVLWSRTTWIAARGVVAAMRPGRAVGLCLIAVVLVQVGFFAGAPSDFAGSPVVLNRGARIPSVMSGTRDVVVPDGKANEPEIGRASCRERVESWEVAGILKKKKRKQVGWRMRHKSIC